MSADRESGLALAEEILAREPDFYRLTGRYIGIVSAHAELWAAQTFRLLLPKTGVAAGADAITTPRSPDPFRADQRFQIKGRGHETMHVTFRAEGIDWLMVVAYDLKRAPVRHHAYCFPVPALKELANQFDAEAGGPVIPLRWQGQGNTHLRLEWSTLRNPKTGVVRGCADTWERRCERANRVLAVGYRFANGMLLPRVEFAF